MSWIRAGSLCSTFCFPLDFWDGRLLVFSLTPHFWIYCLHSIMAFFGFSSFHREIFPFTSCIRYFCNVWIVHVLHLLPPPFSILSPLTLLHPLTSFASCYSSPTYTVVTLPYVNATPLLPQQSSQLLCNRIADLGRLGCSTDIPGFDALLDDNADGLVDLLGELRLLQRVLEHHADGEDHGDGVDDALT